MQLRDLAWLDALAEHEHVTDTAAIVGVSQPTFSRALSRVEDEVGAVLFERLPTGVRATPDGELVVTAAREITARYDRLLADLASRHDPDSGVVRLAFLDSMATSLVPRLLRQFRADAPRVRVALRQEPAHEMEQDLASGAAELAISSRPYSPGGGWLPLQEERLVLVVPPGHRLEKRRRVDLTEIGDDELITTPVGFGFRTLVDALLAQAGVTPAVSFESADLATIEGLVAAGLGVALVPQQFAGASGTVGIGITASGARREVGLTWRSDRELAAPAARFLTFVRELPTRSNDRSRARSLT